MKDHHLSDRDEQLTRWLDEVPGALPPDDLDPTEATREKAATAAVAALLRRHVPASAEPPYPDFFNSQVLKKIRDDQPGDIDVRAHPAGASWFPLRVWLRSPWLAGATTATAVITAVLMLQPRDTGTMASGTRVLSVFSPEPNAIAHAIRTRDGSAVIITVDGLEDYPDHRTVAGRFTDDSKTLVAAVIR